MLVDAIIGKGTGSIDNSIKMANLGLAEFCGNQWNEDWRWKREKLMELSEYRLTEIYRQ